MAARELCESIHRYCVKLDLKCVHRLTLVISARDFALWLRDFFFALCLQQRCLCSAVEGYGRVQPRWCCLSTAVGVCLLLLQRVQYHSEFGTKTRQVLYGRPSCALTACLAAAPRLCVCARARVPLTLPVLTAHHATQFEHKVYVKPFSDRYPRAKVYSCPGQWSWPVNLPLSFRVDGTLCEGMVPYFTEL